jgi:hypothetical protein
MDCAVAVVLIAVNRVIKSAFVKVFIGFVLFYKYIKKSGTGPLF